MLGLKGNQGTLHEDVAMLFDERQGDFAGHQVTVHGTCNKDHGRLETRRVVATEEITWLQDSHDWPGVKWKRRPGTTSVRCRATRNR